MQARAISFASFSPSKILGCDVDCVLRARAASSPSSNKLTTGAIDGRKTGLQRLSYLCIIPAATFRGHIRLHNIRALSSRYAAPRPVRIIPSSCWRSSATRRTTYFTAGPRLPISASSKSSPRLILKISTLSNHVTHWTSRQCDGHGGVLRSGKPPRP